MKPTWWLVYTIGLAMVGALVLVEAFVPEPGVRSALQIALVVVGFGLMIFWNRCNRAALELESCRRSRGTVGHGRAVPAPFAAEAVAQNGSRPGLFPAPGPTGRVRR
jgi:hypothetical protein